VPEGLGIGEVPQEAPAPPAEATDGFPVVGDVLGGYRILGSLGVGGMGQVFRAQDSDLGREVAQALPSEANLPA
jgi:serine/threonine protein kinase